MSSNERTRPTARLAGAGLWLALAGLLLVPPLPLAASPAPRPHVARPSSSVATEGWSMSRIWAHFGTRSGVVQLCFVALAAGLFILMRKCDEGPPGA
jgi:hypothetical protein